MAGRREVDLDKGATLELTSLRTRRKVECRVEAQLGAGGTAKVYAGVLADGTHVVLKAQRWEGAVDPGFELEVELFKQLAHRNVVHCVGVGESPIGGTVLGFRRAYENPLLLMTRAAAQDDRMRRDKKAIYPSLSIDAAIDLGYELLNALEYVEKLGYVHHDVKLANIMIDVAPKERPLEGNEVFGKVVRREYRGVLIDFGATRSRSYLEALSRGGDAPPGLAPQITPFYAPPEALVEARRPDGSLGVIFDPSIDVYAAALVLYAMVTGYPPYTHMRTPVTPNDLESVISVKSAERRGEISPISQEVIARVVLEDTRWVGGDRSAWDQAFYRFLAQRLAPEPPKRGTAAQMKRDFEALCQIKTRQAGAVESGQARVFLPFNQELVRVGGDREHPLMRAARAIGMESKTATAPVEGEPPRGQIIREGGGRGDPRARSGEDPRARSGEDARGRSGEDARRALQDPEGSAQLDWLDEAGDAAPPDRPAPQSRAHAAPRRTPPPPPPPRTPPPDAARAPTPRPDSRTPPPRPPAGGAAASPLRESRRFERADVERLRADPPSPRPGGEATRRPPSGAGPPSPPPLKKPRPEEGGGEEWGHSTERRKVFDQTQNRPRPAAAEEPVAPPDRPGPPASSLTAMHVLMSAVLDEPLLLARERMTTIGREAQADVRIKSDLVSRRHAEVHWTPRGFILKDLGSVNGTLVNGQRVAGTCPLHDGDRISVAGFEVVLRVLTADETVEEQGRDGSGKTTRLMRPEAMRALKGEALTGELGQLTLKDVIEILEWKKHTGTLVVTPREGAPGRVFLGDGQIVHAEVRGGPVGLDAAVQVLTVTAGRFAFTPGPIKVPRSVTTGNEGVWDAAGRR